MAEFQKRLNLFDATAIVVGSMIGSGIFIVSADISRLLGSPGYLLLAWIVTGTMTIFAALSFGELAAMMPKAGDTIDRPGNTSWTPTGLPRWTRP